jgi:LysM repeat protein
MKTYTTKEQVFKKTGTFLSLFALCLLFHADVFAQTPVYVYNETTASGMWFQGNNGGEVNNPVKDAVNASAKVAKSATDGNWQQIQYFPTYTPKAGDKFYFSVHNPGNAGPGQIQFEYTGAAGTWKFVGNPEYTSGSVTGWVEYSIDLTAHVGNEVNKIIFMPAGNNAAAVYVDNIYFSTAPAAPVASAPTYVYNETTASGMWFQGNNGGEVNNPIKDAVNASEKVAKSATDGNWQQIQYFPTYTPKTGDKFYFSVHNPGNAGPGQIQFEYTGASGSWKFVGNPEYSSGSVTGWVEYSIDLTSHVGNEVNKIIFMPAGNNSAAVYVDNIYFGQSSAIATASESTYAGRTAFTLEQNYPNPFNPSTTIGFTLQASSPVTLTVYNLLGQHVATLIDGRRLAAGAHAVSFNAANLASGMYFYRIEAGTFSSMKRMTLVK